VLAGAIAVGVAAVGYSPTRAGADLGANRILPHAPPPPVSQDPLWDRFRSICGNTDASKKLFDEMKGSKEAAAALRDADLSDETAFEAYRKLTTKLDTDWTEAFKQFQGMAAGPDSGGMIRKKSADVVLRTHVLTALFLGSRTVPEKTSDGDKVRVIVDSAAFIDLIRGDEKEPVRKLYLSWLEKRTGPAAVKTSLHAALYGSIPEAIPFARKRIADPKVDPAVLGTLVLVLGNHGDKSDAKRLVAFKDDERVCYEYKLVRGGTVTTQVRDVAAAMLLKLHGQDMDEFGFDSVQTMAWWVGKDPAPFTGVSTFDTDAKRTAALKKTWEWLDKQKPE
jgi:hypothetical protein